MKYATRTRPHHAATTVGLLLIAASASAQTPPATPPSPPASAASAPSLSGPKPTPSPKPTGAGSTAAPATAAADVRLTYHGGVKPRVERSGSAMQAGPLLVELRFVGVNPFCYEYRTNLGPASAQAAVARPAHATAPAPAASGSAIGAAHEAVTAIAKSRTLLERTMREARAEQDALPRPGACAPSVPDTARAAIARVEQRQAVWLNIVAEAETVLRQAERFQHGSGADAAGNIESARAALTAAEQRLKQAQAAVPKPKPGKQPDESGVQAAREEVRTARRRLRRVEKRSRRAQRTRQLSRAARVLQRQLRAARRAVRKVVRRSQRAQVLLASAPVSATFRIAQGERLVPQVTRTPRGRRGATPEVIEAEPIDSLAPILFDVGIGPALTFRNTRGFAVGRAPTADDPTNTARIVRTEEQLNMDVMVSFSMYVWGRRYLDDTLFHWKQLLPRPMFGISLSQPTTSVYAGLSIDPIQFLDISAGVRWYSSDKLIGPQVGDRALVNPNGSAAAPVVQEEITRAPFITLTASTDLFVRWLKRSF